VAGVAGFSPLHPVVMAANINKAAIKNNNKRFFNEFSSPIFNLNNSFYKKTTNLAPTELD